jgi:hypothetical protein
VKLLLQFVDSTPSSKLIGNDLLYEFFERCLSAYHSIGGYINCDPPPDRFTLRQLVEARKDLAQGLDREEDPYGTESKDGYKV